MLCNTCREDLDASHFDPEDYLHSRIYCNIPRCLDCMNLTNVQRTNCRESALEALGKSTKRKKISAAYGRKILKKRAVAQKRKNRPAKNPADKVWEKMNQREKRDSLIARQTPSELLLEAELIKRKIDYDPQAYAKGFWIDFRVMREKLGVEVDGEYHFTPQQKKKDEDRTEILRKSGWTILRFTNRQVKEDMNGVIKSIQSEAENPKYVSRKKKESSFVPRIVVVPPRRSDKEKMSCTVM